MANKPQTNKANEQETVDVPEIVEDDYGGSMSEMCRRLKTGGRQKGTTNKVTSVTKSIISNLLSDYQESGLMGSDFVALEPKDRIVIAERLMQYIMPKMQSTSVDFKATETRITIEQKLIQLSQVPPKK